MNKLLKQIPLVASLRGYSRVDLRGDLSGGLTTAVMLVPQAMAYAMLAGLPPIVGLYASTVPLVIYALLGTSRQLAVGPVAIVSLMVAVSAGALVSPGSAEYMACAVLLAALVGLIQLVMGLIRLGFVVNFLSHPVISGFTSAAALVIGLSQLQYLLGIDLPRGHVYLTLLNVARRLGEIDPVTLAIGGGAMGLLLLLKQLKPAFPGALAVVALGTLAVWLLGLETRVAIVGAVPAGLPALSLPTWSWTLIQQLSPSALAISMVGFMESFAVAKSFARKNRYEIDANKELIGLGAANLGGGLLSGYPVTGGFSRTAVNAQAGARTGLAAVITAAVIAGTLLVLTPLFYYLPRSVLAAIIMAAVFGLVDAAEVKHLYRVKRSDLALQLLTFVATLSLGIEPGILLGIGASLLLHVLRTTRPHTAVLGRLPGTHVYRNVARHPEAEQIEGLLLVRFDAQFYFGNVTFLKDKIQRLLAAQPGPVQAVVINASSINQIDSSADGALHEIVADLRDEGVEIYFAEVRGPVRDVMNRSGFDRLLGEDHFSQTMRGAVELAKRAISNR